MILFQTSRLAGARLIGLLACLFAVAVSAANPAIIPLPQQMQTRSGVFTLCPGQPVAGAPARALAKILVDGASQANGQYLAAQLFKSTGYQFSVLTNAGGVAVKNALVLTTVSANSTLGAEGYELTVAPDSVLIRAPAQAGVFYGIQSFLQLLPPQILAQRPVSGVAWTAPCVYIQDQPRFPWRGWMLDVSRHYFAKDDIKQLLDAMALHKLNTFHWHLVDDHGWRIEILAYPLLTQTGAWRNSMDYGQNPAASPYYNAAGQYGGFYTQADIREIVAYARQRFITVVPEIEMPAHATSGLASYPQFGCGNAVTVYNMDSINYGKSLFSLAGSGCYAFWQQVLTEVMGLFPSQYIHCGGDEVVQTYDRQWTTYAPDKAQMQALGINPSQSGSAPIIAYQHWFSTNIAAFLRSNGRTMVGWSEFEAGGIVTNAVLMDWGTGSSSYAVAAANAGQYVVMTPDANCYLNYYMGTNLAIEPYFIVGSSPSYLTLDTVYNFEPVPAGAPAQYILGAQGNEWTEYIPSLENVEFKAYPRLCAMAEVTWTPVAMKNYADFTQRLATHEQRLTQMGVNYDQTNAIVIGPWAAISTSPVTVTYDITSNITKAGEIDVDFYNTSTVDGLWIYSVALLENGVQIDSDIYTGFAGLSYTQLPIYVLHLRAFKPGAIYQIQASVAGRGGSTTSGVVYLTNWN
jgi:hexosaminidase